jgi:outer membrane lipoprotein-sorting protein
MRFFVFLLLFLPFTAHAENLQGSARASALTHVEQYFNNLDTLVADFMQTDAAGSVGYGKFFLKRPGKLRWQYEPPIPILIVANGSTMAYQDFELNQVSHVSTDSNLAAFLTRPKISMSDKDLVIEHVSREAGLLKLTLRQKGKENEGAMTLIFDESPMQIRKMEVLDAIGKITSIAFSNPIFGQALPDNLFYIDEVGRMERRGRNQ